MKFVIKKKIISVLDVVDIYDMLCIYILRQKSTKLNSTQLIFSKERKNFG